VRRSDAIFFTPEGKSCVMITKAEAGRIATEVVGPATAGDGRGWRLVEFDAGWLIRQDWFDDHSRRGGAPFVVERESGRVMHFPSAVSVDRILTEYDRVVGDGFPYPRDQW
jgi:hypothetical protein